MTVTPCILGWASTECWTPMATFLAAWSPPEAWPEIDDRVLVTSQAIETAMHGLPWKAASFSPDRVAVTRSIKMQLLREVPASLNPLIIPEVTNATGNVGALANILKEIGAVTSGPSVQVVNKGKLAKPKGVTSCVTRKQMWNDLVQAGVP
ncbi:hypothetical protein llap_17887 [Limosa lapponica baueri]|uniref:Uncharacterized protein n=1 Tax=Limosa lapponica baueri TaxID=1758121 RepID=A0A2I0TDB9_LIMLA|nr:hypothetical protein llap_17887 [Limosa lapponica baueri]